jgi:hypothetical protein
MLIKMKRAGILIFFIIILINYNYSQCTGCSTTIVNNSTTSYTAASGQTICISPTLNYTGTVVLNGGVVCNSGTVANVTFIKGTFNNFNTYNRTTSVSISLGGTVTINNFNNSVFNSAAFTFSSSNSAYILNFNVNKGANALFTSSVTHNSGNFRIEVGKDNPGGNTINTSTLFVTGLCTTKSAFTFTNNVDAITTFSNILSLEGTGVKTILNYGSINAINNLNAVSAGSSSSTVTINNYSVLTVQQFINASYTSGKVFLNNYQAQGNLLYVNKAINLSANTNTLMNSGLLSINDKLNIAKGLAVNAGTLNAQALALSGGTLNNTYFIKLNTDCILSNTASVLNNSNTIDIANTFSNVAKINSSQNSAIYTKNYYNTGNSASVNGPTNTVSNTNLPRIYISDISTNSGIINKSLVFDASLTSTTSNIGYGFDAITTSSRIATSVVFVTKGVAPGNGNLPVTTCSLLGFFYSMNSVFDLNSINYGLSSTITASLSLFKKTEPSAIVYTTVPVTSSNYTFNPGGYLGSYNNYVASAIITPSINSTFTSSGKYLECPLTCTSNINVNMSFNAYNTNSSLIESDSLVSIGVVGRGGTPPYTYTISDAYNNVYMSNYKVGIARGIYTINIADNGGSVFTRTINLGYKTNWGYYFGSNCINDSLFSTGSSGTTNQTSLSRNILRNGKDGFVEIIVQQVNKPILLGFSNMQPPSAVEDYSDIKFGAHITSDNSLYLYNGSYFIYLGNAYVGDVLKVEKIGNLYKLYKNSIELINSSAVSGDLRIKGLISSSALVDVSLNFADSTSNLPFKIRANVSHVGITSLDSLANIKLSLLGGSSPYTYTWTPINVYSKDIENLSSGSYSLIAKDYFGNVFNSVYNVGYKVNWNNFYATQLRNDSLMYNDYSLPADSFPTARINDSLPENTSGWSEIVIRSFLSPYVVGFVSHVVPEYNGTIYDMDFGMHITYGNELFVWDRGSWVYIGMASEGDVVQISRNISTGSFDLVWNNSNYYTTSMVSAALKLKAQIVGPPISPVWPYIISVGNSYPAACMFPPVASFPNGSSIINNSPQSTNLVCNISGGFGNKTIAWTPNLYFQFPNTNTQSNTYVTPPVTTHYTATVTDAKGCKAVGYVSVFVLSDPYMVLKREYDGGYYKINGNQIFFKYDGEYNSGSLTYTIYNNHTNQVVVTGTPNLNKNYGDNRFNINATSLSNGFYRLEVVNEKNELFVLKIMK